MKINNYLKSRCFHRFDLVFYKINKIIGVECVNSQLSLEPVGIINVEPSLDVAGITAAVAAGLACLLS